MTLDKEVEGIAEYLGCNVSELKSEVMIIINRERERILQYIVDYETSQGTLDPKHIKDVSHIIFDRQYDE